MLNDSHVTTLFHTLNSLAATGDKATIQRLQDTIFALGLAKPTANLCSPLISAYLDRYTPQEPTASQACATAERRSCMAVGLQLCSCVADSRAFFTVRFVSPIAKIFSGRWCVCVFLCLCMCVCACARVNESLIPPCDHSRGHIVGQRFSAGRGCANCSFTCEYVSVLLAHTCVFPVSVRRIRSRLCFVLVYAPPAATSLTSCRHPDGRSRLLPLRPHPSHS